VLSLLKQFRHWWFDSDVMLYVGPLTYLTDAASKSAKLIGRHCIFSNVTFVYNPGKFNVATYCLSRPGPDGNLV
jgi:hypothetical protein